MKKSIKIIGFLTICLLTIISCNKAGVDGDATVVVFPQHHGRTIPNHLGYPDSVYVFFNTQDLPSNPTHSYDALFVGTYGEDHVHMEKMHTGKYFLFATGWDTAINQRVSGGMALKIKYNERKKEIDLNVPVTE